MNQLEEAMKIEQEQQRNAEILEQEIDWVLNIVNHRLEDHFNQKRYVEPQAPGIAGTGTYYAQFVEKHELSPDDRKIIMLALIADVMPDAFNQLDMDNMFDPSFVAQGAHIYSGRSDMVLPTSKTALFLLCGKGLKSQINKMSLLDGSHHLYRKDILVEPKSADGNDAPRCSHRLRLTDNAYSNILYGKDREMEYSSDFPAMKLTTVMEWDDLVITPGVQTGLKELLVWMEHRQKLNDLGLEKNLQAGFRVLFYGPPGTGKTLCVTLIGKRFGKYVYRVDLSRLVSKFIGETEKNLEKIFNIAEKRDWILFFDEADALFGKRTNVNTSNDRYANQETAYLLQRIETCKNLVILASNMKQNMDNAFERRLQAIVYFPMPPVPERLRLWQNIFKGKLPLDEQLDLEELANKYEIAGGSIINVLRYSALMTVAANKTIIEKQYVMEGLRREYDKMSRIMPK